MRCSDRRPPWSLTAYLAILLAGAALSLMSLPGRAAEDPAQLGISALGQPAVYFDLSMAPGQKLKLSVELISAGSQPIRALTYAADAFTIVNGGLGVAVRGGTATGTTTWLDYPTASISLAPKQPLRRDFTVSVPVDSGPGDYITSLVLENEIPTPGSGGVALDQIVRHALAVRISLPGHRSPSLRASSASQSVVAGRSVVVIAVENTGNSNLKPAGGLTVFADTGGVVSRVPITMDTFYATTSTHVEVVQAGRMKPGHYTAVVMLSDLGTGLTVTSQALPFDVAGSSAQPFGVVPSQDSLAGGFPVWLFIAAIGTALAVGALAALFIPTFWRRRSRRVVRGDTNK